MRAIELAHQVLDGQLVDARGTKMGRVDALELELRDGEAPRVAALLVGGTIVAGRLWSPLARLARLVRSWWGDGSAEPMRIPFEEVTAIGAAIELRIEAKGTRALAWEEWLRERVVRHLPFA